MMGLKKIRSEDVLKKLLDTMNLRMKVTIMCDTEEEYRMMNHFYNEVGRPKRIKIIPTPPKRKAS